MGERMALTNKQRCFVDEYLKDLNATQACIRAGYSKKYADRMGNQLMENPRVAAAIAERMRERSEQTGIDAGYVLRRLTEIDQLDVLDILTEEGDLKPVRDWPKVWRQSISAVDINAIVSGDTEAVLKKIKWPDKLRNLELIGKHVDVGAFREQIVVEDASSLAERLAEARKRAASRS